MARLPNPTLFFLLISTLLTLPLSGKTAAEHGLPFRDRGADYNIPWYIPPERLADHRNKFFIELERRFSYLTAQPHSFEPDDDTIQQARREVLDFALSQRGLLDGIGPQSAHSALTYATVLMDRFVDHCRDIAQSTRLGPSSRPTIGLAALAMTDEYLNLLLLLRSWIPEANIDYWRYKLNDGLSQIGHIVARMITNEHHNALLPNALIELLALINTLTETHHHAWQSVDPIRALREKIKTVFLCHQTFTPYAGPTLDPEKLINPALKVKQGRQTSCYRWPWPVPDKQTQFLICTEPKQQPMEEPVSHQP